VIDVVGIELAANVVRAVALDGWRAQPKRTLELAWDPAQPTDLVAALRERIGPVRRIGLAVGLGFLHPKHVKLPPVPAAERRRMLALEPDRFFPVQNRPVVVALAGDADFAFAADRARIEDWIRAFESWAPVECVEPAPLSLERALRPVRARSVFAVPAGANETGAVEFDSRGFRFARRIPDGAESEPASALPARQGAAPEFLAAFGVARGLDAGPAAQLLPEPEAARNRRRQGLRAAYAAVLCVAALGLALWALDHSRERALQHLRDETAAVSARAEPAVQMQARLRALESEAGAIAAVGGRRTDPLAVLATLSERLPADVTVLALRVSEGDWQIEGTAADAASILPLLAAEPSLEDVRFLSASTRFQDGDVTRETWTIAFRVRAAS
jgi:Tfp pilus assembly protein PilN